MLVMNSLYKVWMGFSDIGRGDWIHLVVYTGSHDEYQTGSEEDRLATIPSLVVSYLHLKKITSPVPPRS